MSIIFKLCHGTLKNENCLSKSSGDTEKKIQQNIHEDITLKNILPTENKKCNAFQSATITMFLS